MSRLREHTAQQKSLRRRSTYELLVMVVLAGLVGFIVLGVGTDLSISFNHGGQVEYLTSDERAKLELQIEQAYSGPLSKVQAFSPRTSLKQIADDNQYVKTIEIPSTSVNPATDIVVKLEPVTAEVTFGRDVYYLLENGILVQSDSDEDYGVTQVTDTSGINPASIQQYASEELVSFITELDAYLLHRNTQPELYEITGEPREVVAQFGSGKPQAVMNTTGGAIEQGSAAIEVLNYLSDKGELGSTQYIDVRLGTRVFFQ
ncbi:MAG: hypothetical protein AAF413_02330 [Patescibacteria group bacterium]